MPKNVTPLHQRVLDRYKKAGGWALGPKGLEPPKSLITLQEGAAYYLGASSSPTFVVLTDVSGDRVKYKKYPFTGSEQVMEKWIAADLLTKGTQTYLKMYGKYVPEDMRRSMESLLRGGKGKKEDLDDYKPVTIHLQNAEELKGQDLWRAAEEYGNVAGLETDDGMEYVVEAEQRQVEEVKKDPRFKVLKVESR